MEPKQSKPKEQFRVQPGAVRRILTMMGIGVAVTIVGMLLHNAMYAFFQMDEPFFLVLGYFVGPLLIVIGVIAFIMYGVSRVLK